MGEVLLTSMVIYFIEIGTRRNSSGFATIIPFQLSWSPPIDHKVYTVGRLSDACDSRMREGVMSSIIGCGVDPWPH